MSPKGQESMQLQIMNNKLFSINTCIPFRQKCRCLICETGGHEEIGTSLLRNFPPIIIFNVIRSKSEYVLFAPVSTSKYMYFYRPEIHIRVLLCLCEWQCMCKPEWVSAWWPSLRPGYYSYRYIISTTLQAIQYSCNMYPQKELLFYHHLLKDEFMKTGSDHHWVLYEPMAWSMSHLIL